MKQKIYLTLFMLEIIVLVYVYWFGKDGMHTLSTLSQEQKTIRQKNEKIAAQSERLKDKITQWQENDFFYEKVAREELNMSRKQDTIYYTS